jgi:hypothetical protein
MSDPQSINEPGATYSTVADSARRLFPDLSLDQVMAELLLERAQKNLIKYQTALRQFGAKYPQGFARLREAVTQAQTNAEQEQDYFDWELAVSAADDMTDEVTRLKRIRKPS